MIPIALGPIARSLNGAIGNHGALPWRLKSDLQLFKAVTLGKPVIMGRKTWDSLPVKPLPGRTNIVLSLDGSFEPHGALVCERYDEAVSIAREQAEDDGAEEICVIGGAALFALALPKARRAYVTEVQAEVAGDVFFPAIQGPDWRVMREERYPAGEGDEHPFIFRVLEKA